MAGRAVAVSCETSGLVWSTEVRTGQVAAETVAYYDPEPDTIRFGPAICRNALVLRRAIVTITSVSALGARFFTPASRRVLAYARQLQRDSQPEYRAACPVKKGTTVPAHHYLSVSRHQTAAERHEWAARYWQERGIPHLAAVARRNAHSERDAANRSRALGNPRTTEH